MISFDTNILVYAADNTAGERHARAADLIERSIRHGGCVQTPQALAEFFSVVTRKASIAPVWPRLLSKAGKPSCPLRRAHQPILIRPCKRPASIASHSGMRCCGLPPAGSAFAFLSAKIFTMAEFSTASVLSIHLRSGTRILSRSCCLHEARLAGPVGLD